MLFPHDIKRTFFLLSGTLVNTLKEALPTLFLGVPRVWEKIHEKILVAGRENKSFIHKQVQWSTHKHLLLNSDGFPEFFFLFLMFQIVKWAKWTGLEHNRKIMNGVTADAARPGTTGWALGTTLNYRWMEESPREDCCT